MKTMWMTVLVACTSISLAQGFDFVPPRGICALGRVTLVEQTGPNRWSIEVTDVRVLLRNSESGTDFSGGADTSSPSNVTLDIITGLGGILVSPIPEWVGRPALFCGIKGNGAFAVPNLPLPLSPSGASFVVFASQQEDAIVSIEEAASILNTTNSVARLQHLVDSIESSTVPTFLKKFYIQQIAQIGSKESEQNRDIRRKLSEWRDGQQLTPELRLCVDEALINHSPRNYQWSQERILFLRNLQERSNLSPENANVVTRRINAAQELESSDSP